MRCVFGLFESEEEFPCDGQDEKIDEACAEVEEEGGCDHEGPDGVFFVLVESGGDEEPYLCAHQRQSDQQGCEHGEFDFGQELFLHGGIDHASSCLPFEQAGERLHEEVEDGFCEEEGYDEGEEENEKRDEQSLSQFSQMEEDVLLGVFYHC